MARTECQAMASWQYYIRSDYVNHLLFSHTEPHFAGATKPERQLLSPVSGGVRIN